MGDNAIFHADSNELLFISIVLRSLEMRQIWKTYRSLNFCRLRQAARYSTWGDVRILGGADAEMTD